MSREEARNFFEMTWTEMIIIEKASAIGKISKEPVANEENEATIVRIRTAAVMCLYSLSDMCSKRKNKVRFICFGVFGVIVAFREHKVFIWREFS